MRWTWLRSEPRRFWVATVLAVALTIPLDMVALQLFSLPEKARGWGGFLVVAFLFALVHAGLSLIAFSSLGSSELRAALAPTRRGSGLLGRLARVPGLRSLVGVSEAPSFGRQIAVVALFAVGVMLVDSDLRAMPLLRLLAIMLVAASWLNLVVTYALHYARLHARANAGLRFAGRDRRTLGDYLYLATAVQTTFGTTDVTVTTTQMRRTVTGHAILAFAVNAVILALSLSLLIATG